MICVVVPVLPDRENHTHQPRPEVSVPASKIEVVMSLLPKRKVP